MVLGFGAAAAFFLLKKKDRVAPVQDREALKKSFDSFDIDNSGELSKEEFRTVMTMRSGLTDAEFEKLFSKVDVDQSGRISFDEYYAWSQE
jgi:Ca2+-binding EF-hand superfamily protein